MTRQPIEAFGHDPQGHGGEATKAVVREAQAPNSIGNEESVEARAEVTQADRDAAHDYQDVMARRILRACRFDSVAKTLGEDEGDNNPLIQAFARHRLAANPPIIDNGDGDTSYVAFQQRRGRLPDLIEEAIGIYDGFMKDDDYDTRRCLGRIIAKLESARDWYDVATLSLTPQSVKPDAVRDEGVIFRGASTPARRPHV